MSPSASRSHPRYFSAVRGHSFHPRSEKRKEQELEPGLGRRSIDVIGTLPAHDMACALGEHGLESQVINLACYGVGIDELGVTESDRLHSECVLDVGLVLLHLVREFRRGSQGGEGVVIGLAQEFHLARGRQLAEAVEHLGSVAVELFESRTGDGKSQLELALAFGDRLQEQLVHGQVAFLRNPFEDGPVGKIVVIMGVLAYIEEAVLAQSRGLMDLEIEAD